MRDVRGRRRKRCPKEILQYDEMIVFAGNWGKRALDGGGVDVARRT